MLELTTEELDAVTGSYLYTYYDPSGILVTGTNDPTKQYADYLAYHAWKEAGGIGGFGHFRDENPDV